MKNIELMPKEYIKQTERIYAMQYDGTRVSAVAIIDWLFETANSDYFTFSIDRDGFHLCGILVEQNAYIYVDQYYAVKMVGKDTFENTFIDGSNAGLLSDGYHTFNELYAHRVRLFSTLMHAYYKKAWWSRKHFDGSQWDGWIIAGIDTPDGPITYHLPETEIQYLTNIKELPSGKEWDGHTSDDVLVRMLSLSFGKTAKE